MMYFLLVLVVILNLTPLLILSVILTKMWNTDFYGVKSERSHFRK